MLSEGAAQRFPPVPTIQARHKKLDWMNVIYPGLSASQVLRLTKGKLPPPQRQGHKWIWTADGFLRLNRQETYQTWKAEVDFQHGRVTTISITCE